MIVSMINSGFGNQLFQYAAGYAAARRIETSFQIDLRFYRDNKLRAYQLDRLRITAPELGLVTRGRIKLGRPLSERQWIETAKTAIGLGPFEKIREADGGDPRATQSRRAIVEGYWQCEAFFADAADLIRREFAFRDEPDAFNGATIASIGRQPSVCVHVRRGDYLSPAEILSPCSVAYYAAAIGRMTSEVPGARYFVFSDDPDWARSNLPLPPGSEFVTGNHGVSDTDDLRLMTHCDHFIIANSTFSWWGAWLSPSQKKRVIAPRPWFKHAHPNEETIVPADWTRLSG